MLHWLAQSADGQPDLERGVPPAGLLAAAELRTFERLPTPKRRADWLLGRWTAKHLAQAVLCDQIGRPIPLAELVIAADSSGAPRLVDHPHMSISISHSERRAFCALSGDGCIGADLEPIAPRSSAFIADYFTEAERAAVTDAAPECRALVANVIWSAKEAALKALRLGLTVDTRAVECEGALTVNRLVRYSDDGQGHGAAHAQNVNGRGGPTRMPGGEVDHFRTRRLSSNDQGHVPPHMDAGQAYLVRDLTPPPAVSWNPLSLRLDARRLPDSPAHIDGWWGVMDGFVYTLALMPA